MATGRVLQREGQPGRFASGGRLPPVLRRVAAVVAEEPREEGRLSWEDLAAASANGNSALALALRSGPDSAARLRHVHDLLGNRGLQALLRAAAAESVGVSSTPKCPGCGGMCGGCAEEDLETLPTTAIGTEPLERPLEELEELEPGLSPAVPIDASAGGTVVCKGGKMEVWISPTMDPCVVPCARKHEEKHIADFQADPNYKDICKGIPDGETFNYRSCSDAVRFETAATDLEIACLASAIPGASKACKPIMQNRKDVTLPNYKRQVRDSCGC